MSEKTHYTDEELEEFKAIILEKMALANREYDQIMDEVQLGGPTAEVHPRTASRSHAH